jgi:hypothetical protein
LFESKKARSLSVLRQSLKKSRKRILL